MPAPAAEPVPAKIRLRQTAARVSLALSLTMLATPLILALFPPVPIDAPASATALRGPASFSAGQHAFTTGRPAPLSTDVATRTVPVVEVKGRREAPSLEKPAAQPPAGGPATSSAPSSPPAPSAASPVAKPDATSSPAPPAAEQAGPPPPAWSETEVASALKACLKTLAPLNLELDVQPPVRDNACGLPAPVAIRRIGADKVELQPPIVVNCAMASALHDWLVRIAQPAAREVYGSSIIKLTGTSGYACRNRNGAKDGPISEHAFGNAVDVSAVVLADGRLIAVLKDWGPVKQATKAPAPEAAAASPAKPNPKRDMAALEQGRSALGGPAAAAPAKESSPTPSKETAFLKRLHGGACGIFGTVLGPDANEAHRDHLHFDLKTRRRSGICQ